MITNSSSEITHHEQRIVREAMDLPSTYPVDLNDSGWDSRVYQAEGHFFKFPRNEEVRDRYKDEVAALQLAADIESGIITPRLTYQGAGNTYLGYRGVSGVPLEDVIHELDDVTKQRIGADLGAFLRGFHALQSQDIRVMGVEQEIARFQGRYAEGSDVLEGVLDRQEQARAQVLVEAAWPRKIQRLGRVSLLSHGDLHLGNILYDRRSGQAGVIDFGDVGHHDQSKDLSDLDDPALTQAVLATYGADETLLQKIALRRDIANLIALMYFARKENKAETQKILPKVKTYLASPLTTG